MFDATLFLNSKFLNANGFEGDRSFINPVRREVLGHPAWHRCNGIVTVLWTRNSVIPLESSPGRLLDESARAGGDPFSSPFCRPSFQ
jgi:hypothetical protein